MGDVIRERRFAATHKRGQAVGRGRVGCPFASDRDKNRSAQATRQPYRAHPARRTAGGSRRAQADHTPCPRGLRQDDAGAVVDRGTRLAWRRRGLAVDRWRRQRAAALRLLRDPCTASRLRRHRQGKPEGREHGLAAPVAGAAGQRDRGLRRRVVPVSRRLQRHQQRVDPRVHFLPAAPRAREPASRGAFPVPAGARGRVASGP